MAEESRAAVQAPSSGIARAGLIAAVLATVANVAVALGGAALLDVPSDYRPLQPGAVVIFTALSVLAGTVVYALLARNGRAGLFPRIAWTVALVTMIPAFLLLVQDVPMMEGEQPADLATVLLTVLLHVIPAAIIVRSLTGRTEV